MSVDGFDWNAGGLDRVEEDANADLECDRLRKFDDTQKIANHEGTAIRRRLLRAAQRGVTLIEILIVLAIIGLIAGGALVAVFPKWAKARISAAQNSMKVI